MNPADERLRWRRKTSDPARETSETRYVEFMIFSIAEMWRVASRVMIVAFVMLTQYTRATDNWKATIIVNIDTKSLLLLLTGQSYVSDEDEQTLSTQAD